MEPGPGKSCDTASHSSTTDCCDSAVPVYSVFQTSSARECPHLPKPRTPNNGSPCEDQHTCLFNASVIRLACLPFISGESCPRFFQNPFSFFNCGAFIVSSSHEEMLMHVISEKRNLIYEKKHEVAW